MGIVMTEDGDANREFVKAARLLHGGRWVVPVAQRAQTSPAFIQGQIDAGEPVLSPIARTLVRMLEDQEDRIRRRRDDLVKAYADRGVKL